MNEDKLAYVALRNGVPTAVILGTKDSARVHLRAMQVLCLAATKKPTETLEQYHARTRWQLATVIIIEE